TLLSGAQAISPEMTGLIRGYFDGTVPAQTVLDAVNEVEAASAEDESLENRESLAEWITLARSVVQIPGMSVSLNTQVQVVEQLRTMDVQLGDLMSQYYDGAVPPNNTIEALSSAESRVNAIDQQLD